MSGMPGCVVVASDLPLVAEAVGTALRHHDYETVLPTWSDPTSVRASSCPVVGGLLISNLVPVPRLREARQCVSAWRVPWLLLTGAPPGPLWGALLDDGVQGVLPSSAPLVDVLAGLRRLLSGEPVIDEEDRNRWLLAWRESRSRRDQVVARIQSLTPRERTVLQLLYAGDGVAVIAERLGVSEATIRSHVKSLLGKFRVNSQLDAVAVLAWLRDDPETLDPPVSM